MKDFIDVRRITKQYETAKALNNVSLTIPEGSLTAIVGKSGCGKTTLLNMIGGLDTPSCGEVYVTGKCITAMKERELSRFRAYSKRAANAEVVSETVAIGVNGGLIILIFAIYSMTNICAMTAERIRSHIRTWGVLRTAGVRAHTAAVTHLGETAFTFILGCAPGAGLFYGLIGSEVLIGEGINPLFVLLYAAAMILASYICIRVTVNRFWSIPVRRMLIG